MSKAYWDWVNHRPFAIYPVLAATQKFMATFVEFSPAQYPDSFTVELAEKTVTTTKSLALESRNGSP